MLGRIAHLSVATITALTVATGIAALPGGTALAAGAHAPSVAARTIAKPPPCKRCCLTMNKRTHRCARYGYHRGNGRCSATCR